MSSAASNTHLVHQATAGVSWDSVKKVAVKRISRDLLPPAVVSSHVSTEKQASTAISAGLSQAGDSFCPPAPEEETDCARGCVHGTEALSVAASL